MINSLGGLGSCNPFKTVFSNNLKNEKSFFGQVLDSVTFVNDSGQADDVLDAGQYYEATSYTKTISKREIWFFRTKDW